MAWRNRESTPWLDVSLLMASPEGNYAFAENISEFNLVQLISAESDPAACWHVASRIADFLGWEVVEDEI